MATVTEPNFHKPQRILQSLRALTGLSLVTQIKLLNQPPDGIHDMIDVSHSQGSLLRIKFRIGIFSHLHNLLPIVFRNEHLLFIGVYLFFHIFLLVLEAFCKTCLVEVACFVVDE